MQVACHKLVRRVMCRYIVLRDRKQRLKLPARVFDDGDGSYTVAAYFLQPGEFTVLGWLWYSDCHGLQVCP